MSSEESAWRIRKYGDTQPFNDAVDTSKQLFYGVYVLENDYWSGARTIVIPSLQTWSFFYSGIGMKSGQPFIPNYPGDIMTDPQDTKNESEPNPANPPSEKLESDSDAPVDGEDD